MDDIEKVGLLKKMIGDFYGMWPEGSISADALATLVEMISAVVYWSEGCEGGGK